MNKLIIVGAGGHGKVIADIAVRSGYTDIAFLDDSHGDGLASCLGFPVIGGSTDIDQYNDGQTDFVIAVGNNAIRRAIAEAHPVRWTSLIHPTAQIGLGVRIGDGTVVMAGAAVNPNATVGCHCIINTHAVVEHDNVLGDYVHISPSAALGGTVTVGACTHIGIGAAVRNNVDICPDCTVGAGTVVVKSLTTPGIYVGVPCKLLS